MNTSNVQLLTYAQFNLKGTGKLAAVYMLWLQAGKPAAQNGCITVMASMVEAEPSSAEWWQHFAHKTCSAASLAAGTALTIQTTGAFYPQGSTALLHA